MMEIRLPREPVILRPGEIATIPVELADVAGAVGSRAVRRVRLTVAGGRAAAWPIGEPPAVDLPAGGSRTVHLQVQPPEQAAPASALLPFTIRADDADDGTPLARATGLAALTPRETLRATLHPTATGRRAHFTLTLRNTGTRPLIIAVTPQVEPAGGRVFPPSGHIEVPAGGSASTHLEVRPPALLIGGTVGYAVTVSCHDATKPDSPPLATVAEGGQAPPRIGRATAIAVPTVLILIAGVAALTGAWFRTTGGAAPAAESPGRTGVTQDVRVRTPYAYVQAFPNSGSGPADAEAARSRLTAAGIPVRLVDSSRTPDLADGPDGLLVILQDGFASTAEAQSFCDRHRALAPRCQVVQ